MIIKIFQSGKGDCLLINSGNTNILVDGGVSAAYNQHVSAALGKLRGQGQRLDLACVSHIDDDHIGGFLKMIEDLVEWRVFDFQKKSGNTKAKKPPVPRPPEIKEVWHNAFHEFKKDNTGDIEDMLAASANIFSASTKPVIKEMGEVAFSKGQAIQLSRRLRVEQLNIPLNTAYGKKLVMFRKNQAPMAFGKFSIHVIAPFESDLDKLRREWNLWLTNSKSIITKIKERVDRDQDALVNSTFPNIQYYEALANEIAPLITPVLDQAGKVLGKRSEVTTPNLASIMFLLEEQGKTLLMTGDGHWEDILKGLEAIGKHNEQTGSHYNVLKVPHHGAHANISEKFCHELTADHYIFCGDGEHTNPEIDAVQAIIRSRTTKPAVTAEAKNPFTLWFNSSAAATKPVNQPHMAKLEAFVRDQSKAHKNLRFKFIGQNTHAHTLTL